jgi:Bacterial pre-peptidase C-terminal domain
MTLYNLGTISNNTAIKKDNLTVTDAEPNDIFKFQITNNRSINLLLTELVGGNPDLALYRDSNGNGTLQVGRDQRIDASEFGTGRDDQINRWRGAGTYFALVEQYSGSSIRYDLYVSATQQSSVNVTGPPNLLAKEQDLGNLTADRSFTGQSVGFRGDFGGGSFAEKGDTSDFYAFTLGAGHSVRIRLDGLSADADIRLIRDADGDRIADPGETVASSTLGGTTPDEFTWNQSGNYFLQVYPYTQTDSINYNLTFDYT